MKKIVLVKIMDRAFSRCYQLNEEAIKEEIKKMKLYENDINLEFKIGYVAPSVKEYFKEKIVDLDLSTEECQKEITKYTKFQNFYCLPLYDGKVIKGFEYLKVTFKKNKENKKHEKRNNIKRKSRYIKPRVDEVINQTQMLDIYKDKPFIFNKEKGFEEAYENDSIVITESCFDVLYLAQMGITSVAFINDKDLTLIDKLPKNIKNYYFFSNEKKKYDKRFVPNNTKVVGLKMYQSFTLQDERLLQLLKKIESSNSTQAIKKKLNIVALDYKKSLIELVISTSIENVKQLIQMKSCSYLTYLIKRYQASNRNRKSQLECIKLLLEAAKISPNSIDNRIELNQFATILKIDFRMLEWAIGLLNEKYPESLYFEIEDEILSTFFNSKDTFSQLYNADNDDYEALKKSMNYDYDGHHDGKSLLDSIEKYYKNYSDTKTIRKQLYNRDKDFMNNGFFQSFFKKEKQLRPEELSEKIFKLEVLFIIRKVSEYK